MRNERSSVRGFAPWVLMIAVCGPAAAGKKLDPVYPLTEKVVVSADSRILVLPPRVHIETLERRAQSREGEVHESASAVADWIIGISERELGARGFDTSAPIGAEPPPPSGTGLDLLVELSDQFVRTRRGPDASPALLAPLAENGPTSVLFQHLEIELATKGSYNAWSGGMRVGMSHSRLRGALVDCASGEVLWRGELFIRKVPRIGDPAYERAVAGMFDTITKEEK